MDLNALAKSPTFDGHETSWQKIRFRFEVTASFWGFEEEMADTASKKEPISKDTLAEPLKNKSRLLYALLSQICSGRALNIVRLCQTGKGFTAWQALVAEYEPRLTTRLCAMLSALLNPRWSQDSAGFFDALRAWERSVLEYEAATSLTLPDEIKCATVARYAHQQK